MKSIIIASTSTLHGGGYLEYILPVLQSHFRDCKSILFIPYARPSGISHDEYTQKAKEAFATINIDVKGIHEFENPQDAVKMQKEYLQEAEILLLVTQLYKNNVMQLLSETVKKWHTIFRLKRRKQYLRIINANY